MRTIARDSVRRQLGAAHASCAFLSVCSALLLLPSSGCLPRKGTIGAVISQEETSGRLFLREVPEGLAAARKALKPGDEILLIDGVDVRFMTEPQIHAALVGEVDSPVKLTVIREEQVLRVTLQRTEARPMRKSPKPGASEP